MTHYCTFKTLSEKPEPTKPFAFFSTIGCARQRKFFRQSLRTLTPPRGRGFIDRIKHDCTLDYLYKGSPESHKKVPPHKSLFGVPFGKGLPIGNLTSQFFANLYLNELDQYIKHTLKSRYYLRYMDDFILLGPSREHLLANKSKIEIFLAQRLALELKPEFILKYVSEGADFLGYIVRPDYLLVRNRVVGNLRSKLHQYKRTMVVEGSIAATKYRLLYLRPEAVTKVRQMLASYLGHFKHANSYRLVNGFFSKQIWLQSLFIFRPEKMQLTSVLEPATLPRTLKEQYHWFERRYAGFCIFFQVGNFVEFYGDQASKAIAYFKLNFVETSSSRGQGLQCGFPLSLLKKFKQQARYALIPYIVVAQTGSSATALQTRVITEKLLFEGESTW